MALSTFVGLFLLAWGCGLLWAGVHVLEAQRREWRRFGAQPPGRRARVRLYTRLAAFTLVGLGLVCFGVTVLRYASGFYVAIPVRGPLVDRAISIAGIVGPIVGFALLFVSIALEERN
jgi:hypothetical protein